MLGHEGPAEESRGSAPAPPPLCRACVFGGGGAEPGAERAGLGSGTRGGAEIEGREGSRPADPAALGPGE